MTDRDIFELINGLSAEEERLFANAGDGGGLSTEDVERLADIKVQLDRCYDLLQPVSAWPFAHCRSRAPDGVGGRGLRAVAAPRTRLPRRGARRPRPAPSADERRQRFDADPAAAVRRAVGSAPPHGAAGAYMTGNVSETRTVAPPARTGQPFDSATA